MRPEAKRRGAPYRIQRAESASPSRLPVAPRSWEEAAAAWKEREEWLADIEVYIVVALWKLGARSASDVAYLWSDEGEAMEFYEQVEKDAPPGSLSKETEQTSVVCLWYRARRLAESEIERMTTNALLAYERKLKRLRAGTPASGDRLQPTHPQDRVGRPTTHLGEPLDDSEVRREVRSVEQLEQRAEAQDIRRARHLVKIFDIYMALGAKGSNWDTTDVTQAERKSAFVRSLQHQSTEKLGAMLRAGIRLEVYLGSRAAEDTKPVQWWRLKSPSVLSSYLEA